jgi:regulator of protease activity HflC (stomatin/prohibitin superfamily)
MILDYLTYAALALVFTIFLSAAAVRSLREYERGVVFTLGRFTGVKGPGLVILIPAVQQMVKVDLRVTVQVVPSQDVTRQCLGQGQCRSLLPHHRSRTRDHQGQ